MGHLGWGLQAEKSGMVQRKENAEERIRVARRGRSSPFSDGFLTAVVSEMAVTPPVKC